MESWNDRVTGSIQIKNHLNRIWIDFHWGIPTESFSANFQEKLADEYYAQLRGNRHKTLGFFNNSGSKIMRGPTV